jgi:hypothetical protein
MDFAASWRSENRFGERIDRDVPGEELREHRSEDEGTSAFERQLVDVHGDLETAAEGEARRRASSA